MNDIAGFVATLDRRIEAIVDACTRCGACAQVCPTPAALAREHDPGVSAAEPGIDAVGLTTGIIDILRGETTSEEPGRVAAARWAAACCGTGNCLDVCEHGINPRFMLSMARRAASRGRDAGERREAGKQAFKRMSRGVRVLSRLQLAPELLARLSPASHPERDTPPDVVFYTGCNLLKTPHIGLLCLDVLDALEISYEVHGGPASCCGILQMRPGDIDNGGRQALRTLQRLAGPGAGQVLSWCPTCQIQFGETVIPSFTVAQPEQQRGLDMTLFPVFLASRLDHLAPLMRHRVPKRVALCEFPGAPGVVPAVRRLLEQVPGLQLVPLDVPGVGYQLSSLAALPRQRDQMLASMLRQAEQAGLDALVGIFHGDHRELVGHQPHWPFEMLNYMELIGASLGLVREDTFKRLRLMDDVDAILQASLTRIEANQLSLEEARSVILADLLGDQLLSTDRNQQPMGDFARGTGTATQT
ncbi:MAG: (Fe-S)-binding protein [Gammaproteobacteria bacterium]|nr:(Fe-S)-binding protein [Gammaproteobacteria bacterium]